MGVVHAQFGEPTRFFDAVGNELERYEGPRKRRGRVVEAPERCLHPNPFNGANCRRRSCPYCGRRWVEMWELVTKLALEAYDGPVMLVTVTAPGQSRLPWACEKRHEHSGTRGCRIKDDYADLWAADAPGRLAALRDAAKLAVKRAGLPVDRLWLERAWEPQLRGVPHAHIVCGAKTPTEVQAAERWVAHLRRLCGSYGFGKQLYLTKPMSGREASRYLAGYLLGRSSRKGTVRDNLGDPRMPRSLIYVSRKLTAESGATVRRLRVVRWLLAFKAGRVPVCPTLYGEELWRVAQVAARLERATGPPDERVRAHAWTLMQHRPPKPPQLGMDLRPLPVAA